MKITTLIENLVYKPGLQAEHGLSLLLDTGQRKILFDTGQTPAFISNAREMGIDLSEVDSVVISHGHYDHTGGLYAFLRENSKAKVYIKREAFIDKYYGHDRSIGITYESDILDSRVVFVDDVTEIDQGIFIMPNIPIHNEMDTSFRHFHTFSNGEFSKDRFDDELYLSIVKDGKLSIVSSCSHRGITNIIRDGLTHFNLPLQLILGGFHLKDAVTNQYSAVVACLNEHKPERVGVCHCTGVDNYVRLCNDLQSDTFYSFTGREEAW